MAAALGLGAEAQLRAVGAADLAEVLAKLTGGASLGRAGDPHCTLDAVGGSLTP